VPDLSTVVDLVHRDVTEGLGQALAPRDDGHGFALAEGFEAVGDAPIADRDGAVAAVPWQWTGVHRGDLLGVPATNEVVTVRGVTLITGEEDNELLHRYIDWAEVLLQLGVRFFDRPVVDVRRRFGDDLLRIPQLQRLVADGVIL